MIEISLDYVDLNDQAAEIRTEPPCRSEEEDLDDALEL
jgi:hypothetical protein